MKKVFKYLVFLFIVVSVLANVYVFLQGLTLGDQIGKFEASISSLKEENLDLEKKVYDSQSFSYAASMAARLNYTKQENPVYIDNLLYAQNF